MTRIRTTHSKAQRGMTLVEVLVSIAVFGVVFLAASRFMTQFMKSGKGLEQLGKATEDKLFAESIITQDLRLASPSFNNISIFDDSATNRFFSYINDANGCPSGSCSRKIELSPSQPAKSFTVLIAAPNLGLTSTFPITKSYTLIPPPIGSAPSVSGSFSFQVNKMIADSKTIQNSLSNNQFSNAAIDQGVRQLLFWGPQAMKCASGTSYDSESPARSPAVVVELDLAATSGPISVWPGTVGALSAIFKPQNPMDCGTTASPKIFSTLGSTNLTATSSSFFESLPGMGGGNPLVMFRPVHLIRYQVDAQGALMRSQFAKNGWSAPFKLADKVSKLTFTRQTVAMPTVTYELKRDK